MPPPQLDRMADVDRIKNVVKLFGLIIKRLSDRKEIKLTDFKGKLGNYKIIETEDNTQTIWSEYFDEACHNLSGAYEETIYNYIMGCELPDRLNQDRDFAVLDVGFGVGVGLKALIDELNKQTNRVAPVFYYSIELDETLLLWSLKNTLPELTLDKTNDESYRGTYKNILFIEIFIGDGRLTMPAAHAKSRLKPINAIFQDAFSPKKNPALWTTEWFIFLKSISSPDVLLSTYSSSISIRKSLVSAGWAIENAKGFALKRTMTKANLTGETSAELILQLSRSPSLEIKDK